MSQPTYKREDRLRDSAPKLFELLDVVYSAITHDQLEVLTDESFRTKVRDTLSQIDHADRA